MRSTVLGVVLVAGLVAVAMGAMPAHSQVAPQGATPGQVAAADDQMIVASTVVEGRYQQLVVLDPNQKSLAVYHVDLSTDTIELRSVRNITWDLQMTHYNGKKPLPSEIQSILEHR
jgi:hypothetical protein